jgi:alginate O-acetyltransferase complex protein AlgI
VAFNSYAYLVLLVATVALRWTLPSRLRLPLLLVSSYLFYASWGAAYSLLLFAISALSFAAGLVIERWPRHARTATWLTVGGLLAVLGIFKYTGFLADQLAWLGLDVPAPSIVLPLGISFFTFVAIGYVIDVTRGEKAERDAAVHLTLVAFFPHLVAGPIVRKREVSEQLRRLDRPFDPEQFSTGLWLVVLGFFKKMVLADGLAPHVEAVFADPAHHGSAAVLVGVLAYAGQIYCDFSGYSDVGIGSAKLLGVDFPRNFDLPYLASSPADFWRRWHITLSRWLRDYVWMAVGGRRRETALRYLTPVLTMTLAGLWHGAAWTFVAWGLYHGLLLAGHQAWVRNTASVGWIDRTRRSLPYRAAAVALTFALVTIGWVLFRATSFENAVAVVGRLSAGAPGTLDELSPVLPLLGLIAAGHLVAAGGWFEQVWASAPGRVRGAILFLLVMGIYGLAAPPAQFIYFQF